MYTVHIQDYSGFRLCLWGFFLHLKYVIEFAEFLKGHLGVLRKQFLSTCLSTYKPVCLFSCPFTYMIIHFFARLSKALSPQEGLLGCSFFESFFWILISCLLQKRIQKWCISTNVWLFLFWQSFNSFFPENLTYFTNRLYLQKICTCWHHPLLLQNQELLTENSKLITESKGKL